MNRILAKLAIIVVIFAVVLGYLFYAQVPRRQMPFKDAGKADAFDVAQGTQSVRLVHASSWTVQAGDLRLPADDEKVRNAILGLSTAQVEEEISDRADRAPEFEVTPDSGLRVTLYKKSKATASGIFGKQAPDYTHSYFSFPGKPGVYLAQGISRAELQPATPNGWRSKDVLNLTEAEVQSVTIAAGGHPMTLTRSSDTWTVNGKPADSARVYALLGTLAHLRAEEFMDPSQPVTFTSTVTIQSAHGTATLRLGAEDLARKRYPASVDAAPGAFWITEDKAKAILLKPSDFQPAKK